MTFPGDNITTISYCKKNQTLHEVMGLHCCKTNKVGGTLVFIISTPNYLFSFLNIFTLVSYLKVFNFTLDSLICFELIRSSKLFGHKDLLLKRHNIRIKKLPLIIFFTIHVTI